MKTVHVRVLLTLAVWFTGTASLFVPAHITAATNFTYNTDVTYQVRTDDATDVTENYHITNNTARYFLTQLKLSTPTDSVSNLSVRYSDGTVIPASITKQNTNKGDLDFAYQQINIAFPRQIYGEGTNWNFSVHYRAGGLVDTKGGSHTVFVPSLEPAEGTDNYNVTVEVPTSFGGAHFTGAKSAQAGLNNGIQYYTFTKAALLQHSLALAFGDVNLYELNFNFPLHNTAPYPRTLTVALPPDLNSQKSYIKKLSPAPANTRLDVDGNVLADYHLNPGQSITVTTNVIGEVRHRDYDLSKSGKRLDIPAELVQQYTSSTHYWQTDGSVAEAARKISNPDAPVATNVHNTYQYVIDKLSYNKDKIKFNIRQGATQALAHPNNVVCLEYADLMVAMLRSQGIPARMLVGYGYSGSLKTSASVADSLHSWVEAYVPGVGWVTLDPTWGEKFDEFGTSDLDHFAFTVWGRDDQLPAAVMAGSSDQNYQYEQASLRYASVVGASQPVGSLAVTRYALLPGLSLERILTGAPAQTASDHNVAVIGSGRVALGSLAPGQHASVIRWALGGSWNQPASATYQQEDGNQTLLLASTKVQVSYWPMAALFLAILATGGWLGWRRLRLAT